MSSYEYINLRQHPGIYKNKKSGRYLAVKKIRGKKYQRTFDSISQAKHWKNVFNGAESIEECTYSTLREVWNVMQKSHFPILALST